MTLSTAADVIQELCVVKNDVVTTVIITPFGDRIGQGSHLAPTCYITLYLGSIVAQLK